MLWYKSKTKEAASFSPTSSPTTYHRVQPHLPRQYPWDLSCSVAQFIMVQIRRKRRTSIPECVRRSLGSVLQFIMVSSVIPATFLARHAFVLKDPIGDATVTVKEKTKASSPNAVTSDSAGSSPHSLSVLSHDTEYKQMFDFLNQVDWTPTGFFGNSDVVELYHCRLHELDMSNFTSWAFPIVNATIARARLQSKKKYPPEVGTLINWQQVQEEFVLELLEIRAQELHLCDFGLYQPALPMDTARRAEVAQSVYAVARLRGNGDEAGEAAEKGTRVVFSIVTYRDIQQLRNLVRAIHSPQHYIFIHIERLCSAEWEAMVTQLESSYDNVFVLKFGLVVYETDLISTIQYRIMYWLTQVMELSFDYYVSLDGASFPLFSATDLASQLVESRRQIWLGALFHRGTTVETDQSNYLRNKRLVATRGSLPLKLTVRVPRVFFANQVLPDGIRLFMNKKTNSGNQAIYSRSVVNDLVTSTNVRELFALSKYGCCCCLEERTWITAMGLIGRQEEALEQAAIWQAWGGTTANCKSSMKNAVLTRNTTVCFKVEDGTDSHDPPLKFSHGRYFWGNETWDHITNARERRIPFVRKFSSDDELSLDLERDIEEKLWKLT